MHERKRERQKKIPILSKNQLIWNFILKRKKKFILLFQQTKKKFLFYQINLEFHFKIIHDKFLKKKKKSFLSYNCTREREKRNRRKKGRKEGKTTIVRGVHPVYTYTIKSEKVRGPRKGCGGTRNGRGRFEEVEVAGLHLLNSGRGDKNDRATARPR